jgi:hypothetical protein
MNKNCTAAEHDHLLHSEYQLKESFLLQRDALKLSILRLLLVNTVHFKDSTLHVSNKTVLI